MSSPFFDARPDLALLRDSFRMLDIIAERTRRDGWPQDPASHWERVEALSSGVEGCY